MLFDVLKHYIWRQVSAVGPSHGTQFDACLREKGLIAQSLEYGSVDTRVLQPCAHADFALQTVQEGHMQHVAANNSNVRDPPWDARQRRGGYFKRAMRIGICSRVHSSQPSDSSAPGRLHHQPLHLAHGVFPAAEDGLGDDGMADVEFLHAGDAGHLLDVVVMEAVAGVDG
jgi:hypothetical protein